MTKKYTLSEYKQLYDVASKAVKEDIEEIIKEAIKMFSPDPEFSEATTKLMKVEAELITRKIGQYMFDFSEDEEE